MKISGIDHVQMAMPPGGEEQARAFYGRLLGIPEKPKPPDLAIRGGLWFEDGVVKIHLGLDRDFRSATKAHPGLMATGLTELLERLRQAGVDVDDDDRARYHRVYVTDPFGNRIELIDAEWAEQEQ